MPWIARVGVPVNESRGAGHRWVGSADREWSARREGRGTRFARRHHCSVGLAESGRGLGEAAAMGALLIRVPELQQCCLGERPSEKLESDG